MSDSELVHSVCRRERLTLFNFLKSHLADQYRNNLSKFEIETGSDTDSAGQNKMIATLNEERIKDLINQEYHYYFRIQY